MSLKWLEKFALILFILCGWCCTKTTEVKSKDETHEDLNITAHDKESHSESSVSTTGAIDKTESSKVDDMGIIAQEPDGSIIVARVRKSTPLKLPAGSKIIGTIAVGPQKETSNTTHQAPSTVTDNSSGSEDIGLDLRSHKDAKRVTDVTKTTSFWPPLWVWLLGVGLLGAAYLILKFYLKIF